MLVVTISTAGAGNCAEVAGRPYVYVDAPLGSFVLPATCPHRGGPLHLATVEAGSARLICPWHERRTSVTKSIRHGLPAVRSADRVTIVFPHDAATPVLINHLPVSDDLLAPAKKAS